MSGADVAVRASGLRAGWSRSLRRWNAGLAATALVAGTLIPALLVGAAAPARADTAPQPPVTVSTVSSDVLPTVQIGQGVVWDQTIVGNTAYAVGEFTTARPAGVAAGGAGEVARSNILAYNLTTGVLSTSWVPSLNGPGRTIRASADGQRIFVGGSFTAVNGVTRNRVAALDAATGALITSWNPNADSRVTVLDVQGGTVYLGGIFTTVGGQPRSRLAAVSASTGAVLAWAPSANAEVMAIAAVPGGSRVVVGGRFTTINGAAWYGMASLDPATGGTLPWAAVSTIRNAGANSAIYSLKSDGVRVYGTGYTFGTGGNFEGSFAATIADGAIVFVTGCRGDEYDNVPIGPVLYYVGHVHDCGTINGHPQTNPWTFQHAIAETTTAAASGLLNEGGNFNGWPAPELLTWRPTWTTGTYTGQTQAPWTIEGNSQYVVVGGEFPTVNGVAQQGLVRFAVRSIAPNKDGIRGAVTELTPTLLPLVPGKIRVAWKASWDRDNRSLTYEVLRGDTIAASTVVATVKADSEWWKRPQLAVEDGTAPAGSTQSYRIRARDPLGNSLTGTAAAVTVPAAGSAASYPSAVLADSPTSLWRLGEASGTTGYDWAGGDDLTLAGTAVRDVAGALINEPAKATSFPGTATVPATTAVAAAGPQQFGLELWFRTTTTTGGKLIGFGDRNAANSARYDRQVYLTNSGQLVFGVSPGSIKTVQSTKAYNDGQWHHVVANLGSANGLELFVDGVRLARNTWVTRAQVISNGFWRVAGDTVAGWPSAPTSLRFAGSLQDVAVYPQPLTAAQVNAHYAASGRTGPLPARPADAYGAAVWDADPGTYWRLDEPAGSATALNRMTNDRESAFSAGVVRGEAGAPANGAGASIRFPGTGLQALVSKTAVVNPTVFSLQTWFKTTTTTGGRLLGFGSSNSQTAVSASFDRYLSMLNNGSLRYGVYNGAQNVITSTQSYNDGQWHLAVATQSGDGTRRLYVDGALAASGGPAVPQAYTGYWRLGSDSTWGESTSANFAGSLDEAAVYDTALPAETISQHYALGKPAGANQPPTAQLTASCDQLTCSVDGSGSTDPDGSVAGYAWSFGDGATGTGATASHSYAAAGTYTVALTVTDNQGAANVASRTVTVATNQAPTAAFTATASAASVSVDGSGSTDLDGTVVGYAWSFGDGATGTGATASHSYAASGTYTVTLTVTDNQGATGTATRTVTATVPLPPLATDTFDRTVASGLGTADVGGAWTFSGTGSSASVGAGSGLVTVGIGRNPSALLAGVSGQDTRVSHTVWTEAMPTGGGTYLTTVVRSTASGSYRARVKVLATGVTSVQLTRVDAGVETTLGTAVTLSGLTYTAGTKLRVVVEAVGSGTTTLRAKVWVDGTTEPAAWTITQSDTTAGLQGTGSVGFAPYLSASATATIGIRYDDLVVSTATA